ncbi:MAG: M20/M25/M40 family metallo-hydrolase [Candidatus Sumerlaeia bacterium]|nr:M20/M25/M40 family metallo-hydrolase [Candidatus Sumerlaeia bacterium]
MRAESLEFFKNLITAPGPSGFEELPRKVWREYVGQYADAMVTDANGSEIATLKGHEGAPSILLMGHIDQIGLIVRYVDEHGYLHFSPIGGVDPDTAISQVVRVLGPRGEIPGVVGKLAIHLQDKDDREKKVKLDDLWVDIGATSKAEAELYAPVGTPMVIGGGVVELLNGRIAARMDNRFGAYVIAEVMRQLVELGDLIPTVHAAATVQEESSRWFAGAAAVAWRLEPTAAIAVDVTHAIDIPGANKKKHGEVAMGNGAVLSVGVSSNNRLVNEISQCCASAGLRIQLNHETGYHGTDADAMGWSRNGVPTVSLGVPMRYMHNTVEMADLADIDSVVEALVAYISRVQTSASYLP